MTHRSRRAAKGTDVFSPAERAAVMRAVRSKNTGPEIALFEALLERGLRCRRHDANLAGTPDLVLPERRAVIFVNGCFWHGHACPRGARTPRSNAAYWRTKIARNRKRDAAAARALRKDGWRVFTVWTCRKPGAEADRIARALLGDLR